MKIHSNVSITDIGYYGQRLTLFPRGKKTYGREYRIDGLEAIRLERYFLGKHLCFRERERLPIQEIYSLVKHVYDHDGVLLARRAHKGAPLRCTGRGHGAVLAIRIGSKFHRILFFRLPENIEESRTLLGQELFMRTMDRE